MGFQEQALKLFLTEDEKEAMTLTESLNKYNKERQDTEKEIFKQAIEKIEQEEITDAIVLGDERWHHGVIGIVASKITDMYFKPSILLCFEEENGKGSGRSIPGFDLYEAVSMVSSRR